jgi:putative transposase
MNKPHTLPNRKNHHLDGYIYTLAGCYFLTICAHDHSEIFGRIEDHEITLYPLGKLVRQEWRALPDRYSGITLDYSVVMPNHFHGLLLYLPCQQGDRVNAIPTLEFSLPRLVNNFKAGVTRKARLMSLTNHVKIWQGNYWDHIVRHETDLQQIREYIVNNPLAWHLDRENQQRIGINPFYSHYDFNNRNR